MSVYSVKLAGVGKGYAITEDDQKLILTGNRAFHKGDVAWTDGRYIFGMEHKHGGTLIPSSNGGGYLWLTDDTLYTFNGMKATPILRHNDKISWICPGEDKCYVGFGTAPGAKDNRVYELFSGRLVYSGQAVEYAYQSKHHGDIPYVAGMMGDRAVTSNGLEEVFHYNIGWDSVNYGFIHNINGRHVHMPTVDELRELEWEIWMRYCPFGGSGNAWADMDFSPTFIHIDKKGNTRYDVLYPLMIRHDYGGANEPTDIFYAYASATYNNNLYRRNRLVRRWQVSTVTDQYNTVPFIGDAPICPVEDYFIEDIKIEVGELLSPSSEVWGERGINLYQVDGEMGIRLNGPISDIQRYKDGYMLITKELPNNDIAYDWEPFYNRLYYLSPNGCCKLSEVEILNWKSNINYRLQRYDRFAINRLVGNLKKIIGG